MRWILGISFIAMAVWMLIPDNLDDDAGASKKVKGGVRDHDDPLLPRGDW
jgi:putative Ca2+/H+ antiporter (TMEM165/GDT1 family)